MKIVLLGPPGAGKGTQAAMIAAKFEIPHISTGDIFRSNIKNGTELGKKAKGYMEAGLLVPDELTMDLVLDRIQEEDCKDGYILDGFPRTLEQAELFDEAMAARGDSIDTVLDIDVQDEVIVNRMSGRRVCPECGEVYHVEFIPPKVKGRCNLCGSKLVIRKDDEPETVLNRLRVYREKTEPLVDYYREKELLIRVDGARPTDEVFGVIEEILGA